MTPSSAPPSELPQLGERLLTTLNALPELSLRISWLRECVMKNDPAELCSAFDPILASAVAGEPKARVATLSFALYLAQAHGRENLDRLRAAATSTHFPNVERMLREGASSGPEIHLEIPVPQYSKERELTIGERRSLARRPTRLLVGKLMLDPSPLVLAQLYGSPTLIEEDLLSLITKRPARIFAQCELTLHPRWMARRRVRFALVQNPGTPCGIALPLIPTLPREDLTSIVQNTTLSGVIRQAALELVERIPPLATDHEEPLWQ